MSGRGPLPAGSSSLCGVDPADCMLEDALTFCPGKSMGHVGQGKGKWVAETSYVYVGEGNGDLEFVQAPPPPGVDQHSAAIENKAGQNCLLQSTCMFFTAIALLFAYVYVTRPQKHASIVAPRGTRSDIRYNCNADISQWSEAWSSDKKAYCCHSVGRGCIDERNLDNYDCSADLAHWEHAWADGKKQWCCSHEGRGCSELS